MLRHMLIGVFGCSLLLSVGCQTGTSPFGAGTTQIPPPPTGAASRNDPYYRPNAQVGRAAAETPYTARNNRRARFTSDRSNDTTDREPEPIDTSLDSTSALPSGLPTHSETNDSVNSELTLNDNLNWNRPQQAAVSPASAYETSRPRPRFR